MEEQPTSPQPAPVNPVCSTRGLCSPTTDCQLGETPSLGSPKFASGEIAGHEMSEPVQATKNYFSKSLIVKIQNSTGIFFLPLPPTPCQKAAKIAHA